MRYTSETIQRIVNSESALTALERISPIYADAENFLQLLQVIGAQLDVFVEFVNILQAEAVPQTANRLISYWEKEYGLVNDDGLSVEKRRDKLLAKIRAKPPMNKYKLEELITAAAGVKGWVRENTAQNTFAVYLHARDKSELATGESAVFDQINRVKPAHLIYNLVYSQPVAANLYTGGIVRTCKNINVKQVN